MANSYFVLTDSESIVSKRFRVIMSGYKVVKSKRQSIAETIGGGLDVAVGSIYERHTYAVMLRYVEPETEYGTKSDLEYFYSLNNPTPTSGSASNLITMIDHFGVTRSVYLSGDFVPEAVSVNLDNEDAWYIIPIEVIIVPEFP